MVLGLLGFLHFTLVDLLDILMVALVIYFIFRCIQGSTAINIFIAIIIVLAVQIVANALGLKMVSSLLGSCCRRSWGTSSASAPSR